ncbi:MAG: hypothetical protein ACI89L_002349 [Phycisphaerales bacterium]|jgi:hypothetical protein
MHNAKIPPQDELPSKAKLLKSTLLAIAIAAVILVTLVLPAEYGIDPTGIGQRTGLKRMGEIKVSLAKEAAAEREATLAALDSPEQAPDPIATPEPITTSQAQTGEQADAQTDETTFELAPDESTEIKLVMNKGEKADFTWFTDGPEAFFDLHADSKEHSINYHGYEKGTVARSEGVLEAAFNGSHGWYWKNRTKSVMTITLQTAGQYQAIKRAD